MNDPLMNIKELSVWLSLPLSNLYKKTSAIPPEIPFIKIGKHLRFRSSDIEKWLESKEQGPNEKAVFTDGPGKEGTNDDNNIRYSRSDSK